jgi:WD40 repeat protein
VRLWDVPSLRSAPGAPRRPSGTLGGHPKGEEDADPRSSKDGVTALAFSADGRTLVTGSGADRTAKLWDVATRREIASLEGIEGQVVSVAFSPPDGRTLAVGHQDGAVKLWDVATQREVLTLGDHTDIDAEVAFAPDGNTLASMSDDGALHLWRAAPAAEIQPRAAIPRP